jgi:heat shock protein HslJ
MGDDFDDEFDEPALPLTGTEWLLVSIEGDTVDVEGRTPSLTFDDEGRVAGTTGVNRVVGSYEVVGPAGAELRIGALATTRMAGPEDAMALEQQFLAALGTGGDFAIDGDVLTVGVLAFVGQPVGPDPEA